jgi:hypothetical protein
MPVTPFHLGPGVAIKAVLGRRVSLMVFAFSQVAMDVEPAAHMLRGDAVLHGFAHTYVGATLVAALSIVAGRPICQTLLRRWPPDPGSAFLTWLVGPARIPWPAAIVGAVLGTYSHVVLDSVMHADMRPLAPFAETNAMLGAMSAGALHLLCVAGGVLGAAALLLGFVLRRGSRGG